MRDSRPDPIAAPGAGSEPRARYLWEFGALLIGLLGLIVLSRGNDLLFHTVAELFSVGVAWAVFLLVWSSRQIARGDSFDLLATCYLFVGILDLCHALSYQGMPPISDRAPQDAATQLWVVARVMESAGLLLFVTLSGRRIRTGLILVSFAITTTAAICGILVFGIFPTCHVAGVGLTPFKVWAEVVVCVLLLAVIALFHRQRARFDAQVYRLLVIASLVTILAELAFTTYVDVYGLGNLIGHCLKIVSFLLVYRALIHAGISRPFAVLFRELQTTEEDLRRSRDLLALRHRVAESLLLSSDGDELESVREIVLEEFASREWVLVTPDEGEDPVELPDRRPDDSREGGANLPEFWARALADGSTCIENAPVPRLSGEGRMSRALSVPLASGEFGPGLVAVGERDRPYSDEDARRLEAVAMVIGPFVAERLARSREEQARRLAQDLLGASERRYRALFEGAPVGIGVSTPAGQLLAANEELARITGWSEEEMKEREATLHDQDAGARDELIATLKRDGSVRDWEIGLVRKDGSPYTARLSVTSVEIGGATHLLTHCQDITEARRMASALDRQNRFREILLNALPYPTMLIKRDRTVVFANRVAREVGAKEGERCWLEFGQGDYISDAHRSFGRIWDNYWIPVDSETYLHYALDITERKETEERLRQSEERLELAVSGTDAALWDWSVQSGECVFNERWVEMLGHEPEDSANIRSRSWQEFCHPTDLRRAEEKLAKCFARETEEFDCECRLRHRSGRYVWTSIRAKVARWDESGVPVRMTGTLVDITDRKVAEEELERQHLRLRELALRLMRAEERERHRLASSLHDGVGQSLALLQLKLLELARRPDALPQTLETPLDLLGDAVRDTRALTYDLSPPMLYELGLGPALEWLAENLTDRFGCRIVAEVNTEEPPLDEEVRALLFRQARELVLNAIKHARAETVVVRLAAENGETVLGIEDDGVGIEETSPDKGFGLFSVEQQVTYMGGRLSVARREGGGTKIEIRLKLSIDLGDGLHHLTGLRDGAT